MGRTLIIVGATLVAIGLVITFGGKLPLRLGHLPGDIVIKGKHSVFYFPVVTCVLVSLVLSLGMWLFGRR